MEDLIRLRYYDYREIKGMVELVTNQVVPTPKIWRIGCVFVTVAQRKVAPRYNLLSEVRLPATDTRGYEVVAMRSEAEMTRGSWVQASVGDTDAIQTCKPLDRQPYVSAI